MNYANIYNRIIEYRKSNILTQGYYEVHHIIPRSLGGNNSSNNLVRLTAKEHYTCHLLLTKMYSKNTPAYFSMLKAFNMMSTCSSSFNSDRNCSKGAMYSYLRESFSYAMKESQKGIKNSQFGKVWIIHPATLETKKIKSNSKLPKGWILGRSIQKKTNGKPRSLCFKLFAINKKKMILRTNKMKTSIKKLNNTFSKPVVKQRFVNKLTKDNLKTYLDWYKIYKEYGFDKFVKITGYDKSKPNLVKIFKKHVPDFVPQRGKARA